MFMVLSGLVLLFLPLSVFNVTGFSMRFGIDLAIIFSILVMCLTGVIKGKSLDYLIGVAMVSSVPILATYYRGLP